MDIAYAIPLAALMVSLVTFVATQFATRRMADQRYVDDIEKRLTKTEQDLAECRKAHEKLREENLKLMRTIILGKSGDS